VRLIAQLGVLTAEAVRIRDTYPDVEIIEFTGGDPPEGLHADAFFGGYMGWDDILRWIDASGVQWVQLSGTGVDNVAPGVFDHDRIVTCARGAGAVPISEWVLAAILAWAKRMPDTFLSGPPKYWNFPKPALDRVEGSTLALVGLGGIGEAIATRALAFGMEVRALRRTDAPSPVAGVKIVRSLDDLLPDAQHVVLAAPSTPKTRHLIDTDAFARMTPGVHLVNIARGALVDQDALRVALDDGTVAQATLDTVTPEPLPAGHWLYEHPKVRMTAHISWYTPQLQAAAIDILIDNVGRYLRGEPLLHVVDRAEGY
jgi:phosphoglycerate dehydrogenase-like enzyme